MIRIKQLALLLISLALVSAPASAGINAGLTQDADETSIELTIDSVVVEIPFTADGGFEIEEQDIGIGFKYDLIDFGSSVYVKPVVQLDDYSPAGLELAAGTGFNLGALVIQAELGVHNPNWTDTSGWRFKPGLGISIDFTKLLFTGAEA